MEFKEDYDRINGFRNIEGISKEICEEYKLGQYITFRVFEIGYEDFNYLLETSTGKYVVKILNTERDEISIKRLIKILSTVIENNINTPKLYKVGNEYVYKSKVDNSNLSYIVMEYIGKNLYSLNRQVTLLELKEIAKIASGINQINFEIYETFYDEWTVSNLEAEYLKKKNSIEEIDKIQVERIVGMLKKVNLDCLRKCYIHGDIIKANLLLNENDKLFLIDFSAFNYLPRIIELAVIILGECMTDDRSTTILRMNYFLNEYDNCFKLDKEEINVCHTICNALAAMFIIQSSYIKNNLQGDYKENEYWLETGRRWIEMNITEKDIQINREELM